MNEVNLNPGTTYCLRFVARHLGEKNQFFEKYGLTSSQITTIRTKLGKSHKEFVELYTPK